MSTEEIIQACIRNALTENNKTLRDELSTHLTAVIQDTVKESTSELQTTIKQLHEEINDLKSRIDRQDSVIAVLQEEARVKPSKQTIIRSASNVEIPNLRIIIADEKEREGKKANLIIFDMPESSDSGQTDVDNVKELMEAVKLPETKPNTIKRIGQINEKSKKPRPLLLTFSKVSEKYKVLGNSKKLRELDDEHMFKKVIIKPDLTKIQIAEEKKLRDELIHRRKNGEKVKIHKGTIILDTESK